MYEGKVVVRTNSYQLLSLNLTKNYDLSISILWRYNKENNLVGFSIAFENIENFKLYRITNKYEYINA